MLEKPHNRNLHLKLALITWVGIILPLIAAIFFLPNPIYSLSLGILMAAITMVIIFQLLKPLSLLLKGTESLSNGNLNFKLDIRSADEFEELAQSFNSMATKLQQSFTNLEQDKNLILTERNNLEVVLSSVIDGVIAVDFNKNVVLVNKSAEYLTGYSLPEMTGRPIDQFIHLFKEQQEVLPKNYCQAQKIGQVLKLVGKDGKQVKVNLTVSAAADGVQTNLSCILIFRDLSKEQELEQMRLDFVSMASHELKTPLTSIVGYLSVFTQENRGKVSKEEMELLGRSLVSAKQLLSLVQNLLSVNRIEREQLAVEIQPTNYWAILTKSVEDLQNVAKQKNITLNLASPQTPLPPVLSDPIHIVEVIDNLVANAINYTHPGGQVNISTQVTATEVVTTVADNGIGIPKEAIPHLFNKFFRVSNQLQKGNKGTGLGLYISKSIITKLGGKIWVESEVSKGSKFNFSLPIAPKVNLDTDKFTSEAIQSGALNY